MGSISSKVNPKTGKYVLCEFITLLKTRNLTEDCQQFSSTVNCLMNEDIREYYKYIRFIENNLYVIVTDNYFVVFEIRDVHICNIIVYFERDKNQKKITKEQIRVIKEKLK